MFFHIKRGKIPSFIFSYVLFNLYSVSAKYLKDFEILVMDFDIKKIRGFIH